jgi:Threonine dehydrogenase and related Zn-dependent dehydrogenases
LNEAGDSMNSKMKAAVLSQPREIVFEERMIPVPQENEVLIKMKHVGICGSDIHYYEHGRIGDFVVKSPIVLGHESSGEVVEAGKNVTGFQIGDTVTMEPGHTCGKCEFCKKGLYNLCNDVVFMATPPYDGAFVEYLAYPADMVFKLPAGMSTVEGALIEPLAVGFHAASQAGAKIGDSAMVLGSGCIGLVTLMTLKAMGVTTVYVADIIPKRLKMAEQLGASQTFKADERPVVESIMELTRGRGVDMVFETAGNKITTQQTVDLVKRGGRIVLVGMTPEAMISFDFGKLISKEASIKTVFRYRNFYPAAIKAVENKMIPLKEIVTNTFKFAEIPQAMDLSVKNKQDIVKSIVEF